jgi:hypothetical protein
MDHEADKPVIRPLRKKGGGMATRVPNVNNASCIIRATDHELGKTADGPLQ